MKNPFRNTKAIDVFMVVAPILMTVYIALVPEIREAWPIAAVLSLLTTGGYLAGYRWVP